MSFETMRRVRLAHTPTPFHAAPRLAERIGVPALYFKRDDCTGLALGGNKTRKLEFTFGDVLAKDATVVITCGGVQSNHVRQTAAAAARLGLPCHVVLHTPFASAPQRYLVSGNRLLDELLGATLHFAEDGEAATDAQISALVAQLEAAGERPYVIPLGASDGIGSLGYVGCAKELLADFQTAGIVPSHVFLATGSAGTHGGLLAGLRLERCGAQVIGISVSEPAAIKRDKVRRVITQIGAALGMSGDDLVSEKEIVVYDDYAGLGYGHATQAAEAALRMTAECEGVLLDPVYTAKAAAGMFDLLQGDRLGQVTDPVFLHTGGVPALFAYEDIPVGERS